ncbi:leucine-rich repeat-containing protein 72 isoform X1 [Pleurodeles waltl]|uniref:leucine-rich repeat-containing protein 72 isoform X1 n=2 Tax=Pleurodeles waltl TaxID=8319 RepID=UPI003709888F
MNKQEVKGRKRLIVGFAGSYSEVPSTTLCPKGMPDRTCKEPYLQQDSLHQGEMDQCTRAIEEQLMKCAYKRCADVQELYLARKGLKEVTDLSRFKTLKYLWLNHNKIQKITCLTNNYCLSELYLNNNELKDISGSLRHLTSLQILLLHSNHLTNLEDTVKELKRMTALHTLNLFYNPLSQDTGYRSYVINHLPSVQLLDRQKVTLKEKKAAFIACNPKEANVLQSLAFGRRSGSVLVPKSALPIPIYRSRTQTDHEIGNNLSRIRFPDLEDAVFFRAIQRCEMHFSVVDWHQILNSKQRRLQQTSAQTPQLLTVKLR